MKTKSDLLTAPSLHGSEYCRARSAAADSWLAEVFATATEGDTSKLALVAVGGYGRGVLWPQSDLDLVLFHNKRRDIAAIAERLWYPIWDRNLKLGHAVLTPKEAGQLASAELERATAFSVMRLIAGSAEVLEDAEAQIFRAREKRAPAHLRELARVIEDRHTQFGDVAFRLEPDLKEGRGGIRDLDALRWAESMQPGFAADLLVGLDDAAEVLTRARVELHRSSGRSGNRLTLDDQDVVAAAMGEGSGQTLMKEVSLAARRIAWNSDEAWRRWQRTERESAAPARDRNELLSDDIQIRNGALTFTGTANPVQRPALLLELAVLAAQRSLPIDRIALARLQNECPFFDRDVWDERTRRLFAELFLAGPVALAVVEDLDNFNLMARMLPEWDAVRSLPQRNVLHTFTVDRHLCETAVNAAALADRVGRPDLLVVGALLHDIGKGFPGDHTEVGMDIINTVGTRMGYPEDDIAILVDLCRHHLLLSDVAVRRDLADDGTIQMTAAAVYSKDFLHLLAALTEADSIATGPAVWGSWKKSLMGELVFRTEALLDGEPFSGPAPMFPSPETRELMAQGKRQFAISHNRLTVITPNEAGTFSAAAGVLMMNGLDVVQAAATSERGMAANEFLVSSDGDDRIDWEPVLALLERALDRRLAVSARVADRAEKLQRYRRRLSATPPVTSVVVDNRISSAATVVDVHAPDAVGVLYRITRAMADLRLDIGKATVQTLGPQAVDSFYVTDADGNKLDAELVDELKIAVLHAVNSAR
ncbi:MAG: [protein-PII] uridylyltransferase [Acidimicrobiales bacterium]|nr:[protein-PII] uridylyltransferase [Acidimicrobiales bacterium]